MSGATGTWNMDVTDVLRDRAHEPSGFQRMTVVSIAVHVVALAGFMFAPAGWLDSQSDFDPKTIMTISLGSGGEGPQSGGLTTMGGRAVQAPAPEQARPEPVRPPAAVAPEMTLPTPGAKPRPSSPDAKQAPDDARGRTATRGAEPRPGTAIAETGVRGQGFGLSSGGGPGVGASLDVGDFCCPDYILTMVQRITKNWSQRPERHGLGNREVHDSTRRRAAGRRARKIEQLSDRRPRRPAGGRPDRTAAAVARCVPEPDADGSPPLSVPTVKRMFDTGRSTMRVTLMATAAAVAALVTLGARGQQPPPAAPPAAQQPAEITTTITGEGGAPPRLAVPQFIALTNDAETQAIARTITEVLFDDLAYEREFALIPRDVYATIAPATSITNVPFDRWRELNADGLIIGTVQKVPTGLRIEVRLFDLNSRQPIPPSPFAKEYSGSAANPRLYAHTAADEIHDSPAGAARRGPHQADVQFRPRRGADRRID